MWRRPLSDPPPVQVGRPINHGQLIYEDGMENPVKPGNDDGARWEDKKQNEWLETNANRWWSMRDLHSIRWGSSDPLFLIEKLPKIPEKFVSKYSEIVIKSNYSG